MKLWGNKWTRASVGLLFGIAALSVTIGLVSRVFLKATYLKKIDKIYSSPKLEIKTRILKDLEYLRDHPLFLKTSRQANGAELIHQHIPLEFFDDGTSKSTSAQKTTESKVQELSKDCLEEKMSAGTVKHRCVLNHPLFREIDVSWMAELPRYDHWSVFDVPQVKSLMTTAAHGNYISRVQLSASLPSPNANSFLTLALIRFLKTKDQNLKKAYRDYWHTLDLLHSNHTLIGSTIAVTGIEMGHELQQDYPLQNLREFDLVAAAAYKRLAWSWIGLLDSVWSEPLPVEFEEFLMPELGMCTGVGERPYGALAFHELIEDSHWPFEMNFSDKIERMKNLRIKVYEVCQMHSHQMLLKPELVKSDEFTPPTITTPDSQAAENARTVARVPYLRRIIWGILASIGSPDYYRHYDDREYRNAKKP